MFLIRLLALPRTALLRPSVHSSSSSSWNAASSVSSCRHPPTLAADIHPCDFFTHPSRTQSVESPVLLTRLRVSLRPASPLMFSGAHSSITSFLAQHRFTDLSCVACASLLNAVLIPTFCAAGGTDLRIHRHRVRSVQSSLFSSAGSPSSAAFFLHSSPQAWRFVSSSKTAGKSVITCRPCRSTRSHSFRRPFSRWILSWTVVGRHLRHHLRLQGEKSSDNQSFGFESEAGQPCCA